MSSIPAIRGVTNWTLISASTRHKPSSKKWFLLLQSYLNKNKKLRQAFWPAGAFSLWRYGDANLYHLSFLIQSPNFINQPFFISISGNRESLFFHVLQQPLIYRFGVLKSAFPIIWKYCLPLMMRFTKRGRVCIKAFLTLCYTIDAVSLFCLWINQQISIDLYFTYVGQIRIIPFEDGEGSP